MESEETPPRSDGDLNTAFKVAKLYYIDNISKVEIADRMNISRFRVARLLDIARSAGIVSITIKEPNGVDEDASSALQRALGIERVLVVGGAGDPLASVSAVAARYITDNGRPNTDIGLAWSRSSSAIIERLGHLPVRAIVQLCGVIAEAGGETHNVELVRSAAGRAGSEAVTFYAPLVLPDAAGASALRQHLGIARALQRCDRLAIAVIAIGAWSAGHSSVFDTLTTDERAEFSEAGAVAETCGILFDEDGIPLEHGLQDRTIGITAEQLGRAGDVVAFALSATRAPAVIALARGKVMSTLIVHADVAKAVLADLGRRGEL